ncbi:ribonuclease T2 [Ancylobacter sp. 6x-1]|uniref:Ribonuclease T2 n=1 Tax=Ancylobacter crimeensis TaxID=2579147 RepID=A0ABT0D9S2_9HYPH|nr:ribonuclease T2 [Ancylobacter crimeensis]
MTSAFRRVAAAGHARLRAAGLGLLLAVGVAAGVPAPVAAQQSGTPGGFDHYVLALSWSPSYCADAGNRASPSQCGVDAQPFAFVVHGLWPQYDRGWPQNCQNPAPRVPEQTLRGMLDLMPSRGLVLHEWRTHGTCSGLSPDDYFDTVRRAAAKVTIPERFRRLDTPLSVTPGDVEAAFRAANPGMGADMIAVDCGGGGGSGLRRLGEVRICLDRSLGFTSCPEVDGRACRVGRLVMPPVRGN